MAATHNSAIRLRLQMRDLRVIASCIWADESAQGLLSPRFMEDAIGALHLDVLSDAMAANESGNLDALMVHSSALYEINADALAALYDHGVVLVFFNVYSRVIGETLGDSTIFSK